MTQKQKIVAKILSYLIRRFFIISNNYINNILQTIQQTLAVDEKNLHYIRRKIVIKSKKIKTITLNRIALALSTFGVGTLSRKNCNKKAFNFVTFKWI